MTSKIRVLLVDNSEDDTATLIQELRKGGYTPEYRLVNTAKQFIAALEEDSWDIVFTEYLLPGLSGNTILDILKKRDGHIPVIMISSTMGEATVPVGMKSSANDYFIKGNYARLIPAVQRELRDAAMWKEHQATLQELRRSEARYRAVVEDQTEFINRYSLDGVITFANTAYARLYGKTPEEIVGLQHQDFLNEEAIKTLESVRSQLSKDNPIISSQHCHVFPNGDEVWLQWHDRLILDAAGKTIEYQGVGRDITELKKAETDLKKFAENLERYATQLQVAAEIAREAATFHGLDSLLKKAVDLVRDGFGFYHTAVFLIDEDGEYAKLIAASGEAGEKLLTQEHKLKIGELGIISHVAMTGQPRISQDVGNDATHMKQPLLPETRSEMAVPLKVMDKVIGVFDIQSRKQGAFDGNDLIALQTMANQLAIAVDNIRLFTETQQRSQELASLYAAAIAISNILDTDTLLERLYQQVQRMIAPDTVMVSLYEPRDETFTVALAIENGKPITEFLNKRYPVAEGGLTGWVLQNRQPLLIGDIDNDLLPIKPIPGIEPVHAWLGVPLISRSKLFGTFSIQSFQPNVFDESHQRFLESLAAQSAIAIENARLFEAEEKRVAALETLRQVSLGLTASLEPGRVLDSILDGVFELIPDVEDAHIFSYDGETLAFESSLWHDGRRGEIFSEPRKDGLTYKTAQSGETIVINDFTQHPMFKEKAIQENWKGSIVGIPIKIGERVVGVLNVAHQETHAFKEMELRMLRLMGDQAALAIENANLFEQTMRERRHISLLYDVGQAMAVTLDPDTIAERAIELTCQAMGASVGAIWVRDSEGDTLYLNALFVNGITGIDHLDRDTELRMDQESTLVGWSAQQNMAINIPDVSIDERWTEIPYIDEVISSMIASPISDGQNLLGSMAILHPKVSAFTDDHLDLLQSICHQVGLALSNARRYQDINRLVDLLAAEQNRLESLIEMLPVGVLLLDADCHLLVANPLGREILSVLSPSTTDNVITYLGDIPLSELLELQHTTLPLEISVNNPKFGIYEIQTLQIGGESIQWVLTLRDVTYEREIQERVQMQNRLATVGQLAAGIAHDFNNIMAAIVVYADLLMMEPSLSDTSQEKLAVIQQQIQRASSLIRQILDFSRRSIMEKSKLDLLPFMKEMQKLLERTLPETMRIELKAEDAEYIVMADPTRMQQVFMNLALNARDAMENGGCLSFHLERVHYARDIDPPIIDMPIGEWIRIFVRDTGAGIPPENLTHIFEPFFTTKPVGQGTGLGLAQVYGIVRQHEGYMDVKSQLQKGTQFDIFLPALLAELTDHEPADDARQLDGSGKTVLVVEDDDTTRTALQALLNTQHFDVLLASNGNEAIKLLNKDHHKIALVISDIVMPEMGGMDLFTIMQIQWPHIHMLLITGHPLDNQVQGILERSNMVWLQKPFSVTDVNKAIGKLLAESN